MPRIKSIFRIDKIIYKGEHLLAGQHFTKVDYYSNDISYNKIGGMYKTLLCIILIPFSTFFISAKHDTVSFAEQGCMVNDNLYEPLLLPTRNDTLSYFKFYNSHPNIQNLESDFSYEMIPLVRGLIDTALLSPSYYLKFKYIDDKYKLGLVSSPLIIEGEIENIFNEDTSVSSIPKIYITNYIIRITDIVKTKYKIVNGDRIIVKDRNTGYSRFNGRVSYKQIADIGSSYEKGKKYFFLIGKYSYMSTCYYISHQYPVKEYDEYCPYAFSVGTLGYSFSKDFSANVITKQAIIEFLKLY